MSPGFARSVRIPQRVIADMLAHAREDAPRECCGLLIGNRDVVIDTVRARNVDPSSTRYLIDPEDHFTAIHQARAQGSEVIGAYHSHPASAPVPSRTDIDEANGGSDFLYVIVSLVRNEVQAYRIENGAFIRCAVTQAPA